MYFPYLRGKQFELIALREISSFMNGNNGRISPIIEPVKDSSTLKTTLRELKNKGVNFNVIINPSVGDLIQSTEKILSVLVEVLSDYSNYQLAIVVEGQKDLSTYINKIKNANLRFAGLTLIHNAILNNISEVLKFYSENFPVCYNVVNFKKTNRRYHREFQDDTRVELDDFFISQNKNADYLPVDDSQFSEEHLFYSKDGFVGFSDFLTIGDNYSESGFLPYAVAIHLSYPDKQNKIRIKHFVSDSNDDPSDIGGKFAQALDKLVEWCDQVQLDSMAIQQFRELHESGHFPGLGSIKKLSIMHHIELVLTLMV